MASAIDRAAVMKCIGVVKSKLTDKDGLEALTAITTAFETLLKQHDEMSLVTAAGLIENNIQVPAVVHRHIRY